MPLRPEPALPNEGAIRTLAGEILERPEYAKYRGDAAEAWRELIEALIAWLAALPKLHLESPVLYWTLLLGLGTLALLLFAHIVWSLTIAMRQPASSRSAVASREDFDFMGEAQRLAQGGAHLEASHQLLLATLAYAAQAHLFDLRPEDGNRRVCEKLNQSPIAPGLRERLIALILRTQATWFGSRTESIELYDAWRSAYGELRRSVR